MPTSKGVAKPLHAFSPVLYFAMDQWLNQPRIARGGSVAVARRAAVAGYHLHAKLNHLGG